MGLKAEVERRETMRAEYLTTEYVQNPMALTERQPVFSFVGVPGEGGTCFCIAVADRTDLLPHRPDMWQSEVFDYADTCYVRYAGKPLLADTVYYWVVTDGAGNVISKTARFGMGLFSGDWRARWVGRPAPMENAPIFLQGFRMPDASALSSARLYITGLGYFVAYINGKRVSADAFVPQVSDYESRPLNDLFETAPVDTKKTVYYLCYEVSALLNVGENTLACLVGNGWYHNREKANEGNFCYGEPKALFELRLTFSDGNGMTVESGADTRIADSNLLKNTLYTGEIVDFCVKNRWNLYEYKAQELSPAVTLPDSEGELLAQTQATEGASEVFAPVCTYKHKTHTLYDFGQNHSGLPHITLTGKKGARVKLFYGEEMNADETVDVFSSSWGCSVQTDELILSGGMDEYCPTFTIHGYRYLQAELPMGAVVKSIRSEFVHSMVERDGAFSCAQPLFERINQNYCYTHLSNLHGNVSTDCPHRERRGYLGDGHAHFSAALYNFGMRLSFDKWLKDIRDAQSRTGYMPHTAPFAGGGGGPGFGMGCILMPLKYYHFYGDVSVLHKAYMSAVNWVKYLNTRHDGNYIVVREEKGWCIGEWFNPVRIDLDIPFANTYFFAKSVALCREMAILTNNTRDLKWLDALYGRICAAFLQKYYDPECHVFCGGGKGAAFFGLDLGLLNANESVTCLNTWIDKSAADEHRIETGIFGTPLMIDVLAAYGRNDVLYQIFSRNDYPSYGYMIARGATTLWEAFEERIGPEYIMRENIVEGGYGTTHNHPMRGSVCVWFYEHVAGLGLAKIGSQREMTVSPYIEGELTHATARKRTIFGAAAVEWKKTGKTVEITFCVPFCVTATVRLLAGHKCWVLDGKPTMPQNEGLTDVIQTGDGTHYLTVEL
jgi:alpha-L-rhamnosidase